MDPVMLYHLGQIRQQEILREAENWRHGQALYSVTLNLRLWERLRARLPRRAEALEPTPVCREMLTQSS